MITLQNKARRPHVITLVHHIACEDTSCKCGRQTVGVTDHDNKTGNKTVRALRRKVPHSVTLLARGTEGDTLHGLPNGVRNLPEVKTLLRRGEITILLGDAAEQAQADAKTAAVKLAAARAAAKAPKPPAPPPADAPQPGKE